jgi:hypothetical protein
MRTKIHLLALSLVIIFLFRAENVKAENNQLYTDSTCCAPDSLVFISATYPVFCVSWHVRSDSVCHHPQGFEVQWKLLTVTVWKSKTVTYTTGTIINFCDSVDTCGAFQWRVRTKCTDSTYSDWVYGKKFTIICGIRRVILVPALSIAPNPANSGIVVTAKNMKPGPVKITIANMFGKTVLEKTAYVGSDGQLVEKLPVSGSQKGIYFVSIVTNGVVISRGRFLKE